ncbi:hypothetical protein [Cryobacterium sp. TMT2-15-1]
MRSSLPRWSSRVSSAAVRGIPTLTNPLRMPSRVTIFTERPCSGSAR